MALGRRRTQTVRNGVTSFFLNQMLIPFVFDIQAIPERYRQYAFIWIRWGSLEQMVTFWHIYCAKNELHLTEVWISTPWGPGAGIARRFQFFGSGLVLGSCFRVKNLPRFLHRFLEPVLEPSSVWFSVFYEGSRFFLGIPNFCQYSSIFLDFLGLFGRFF